MDSNTVQLKQPELAVALTQVNENTLLRKNRIAHIKKEVRTKINTSNKAIHYHQVAKKSCGIQFPKAEMYKARKRIRARSPYMMGCMPIL
ncbi:MAG: hypothetical protein KUG76_05405 [Gammaproteobacteria bacterium]|nr:hypothetical protein [Gammaproteobacteria bacterium]